MVWLGVTGFSPWPTGFAALGLVMRQHIVGEHVEEPQHQDKRDRDRNRDRERRRESWFPQFPSRTHPQSLEDLWLCSKSPRFHHLPIAQFRGTSL